MGFVVFWIWFSVWLVMRDLKLLTLKEVQKMQLRKQTEEGGSKRYVYIDILCFTLLVVTNCWSNDLWTQCSGSRWLLEDDAQVHRIWCYINGDPPCYYFRTHDYAPENGWGLCSSWCLFAVSDAHDNISSALFLTVDGILASIGHGWQNGWSLYAYGVCV